MTPLIRSLRDLFTITLNDAALARLQWKDFGNGLCMARLASKGEAELLLYRIESEQPLVFLRHEHLGGEIYLILSGTVEDEYGTYCEGDFVFLERGSTHQPRAARGTTILVLWPNGIRLVD